MDSGSDPKSQARRQSDNSRWMVFGVETGMVQRKLEFGSVVVVQDELLSRFPP